MRGRTNLPTGNPNPVTQEVPRIPARPGHLFVADEVFRLGPDSLRARAARVLVRRHEMGPGDERGRSTRALPTPI